MVTGWLRSIHRPVEALTLQTHCARKDEAWDLGVQTEDTGVPGDGLPPKPRPNLSGGFRVVAESLGRLVVGGQPSQGVV